MKRLLPILGALTLAAVAPEVRAEPGDAPLPSGFRRIRVIDFEGEIGPVTAAYMERQVARARQDSVDAIVLRIDSPGGIVGDTLEIGDLLVALPESIHTVAWVPEMAYSGAAFTAIACREIVMGDAAHLGDAQPIMMGDPSEPPQPVGEKFESPLRAKAREYAEKNGHPALLAEAMVSASIEVIRVRAPDGSTHLVRGPDFRAADDDSELVPGRKKRDLVQVGSPLVAEGQLLTMTAREAEEFGFLDRSFEGRRFPRDERELLAALGAPDARIEHVRMSFAEEASRVLLQFAAILGAVVTLSLMLLLFQGPGVMTIVGGVALGLTILIHLTAGLVHGFPLFLLLVGALLLAVEILLIPGFGIPGILGIVSMAAGFLFLAAGTTLGDAGSLTGDLALDFAWKFVVTAIVGFAAVLLASRWFPKMGPGRRLLLAGPAGTPPAPVAGPPLPAKGEIGVARSPLRPAGTAEFDGRLVDVVSDGPLVETGERVRVSRVEGRIVTVLPAEGPPR